MADGAVRMVVGDVGGGFGIKGALYPEDVVVSQLARRLRRPVGWVETRSEHMATALHARDHHYSVRAGFEADGTLVAIDAVLHANVGAYSSPPWTAGIEPLMAGGLLTGPYKLSHYRCEVLGVATNTTPTGPYRGVARPATVFVMERLLDDAAAELGMDPLDIRRRNLVAPDDLPYTAPTRLVHDSRTYLDCLDQAVELVDYQGFRSDQAQARAAGVERRAFGIGFACYNELTGLGQKASAGPRLPFRTGHESAEVRVDPSGAITAAMGVTSQGQGLETTMAQVVAAELGVGVDQVTVEMGDTDRISFGMGAFASRQGVIGSGAATLAARAVLAKVLVIAAHLLEAEPDWLSIDDGFIHTQDAPAVGVTLGEVAHVAYFEPHRLPPGLEPGLEAMRFYDPMTGTFAAGAQAAVVAVDLDTGEVDVQRIVCAEDTGRVINPMIVEGQMHGAIAQGVGGALYEHFVYDADGQLHSGTFMDYLAITADRMPSIELGHIARSGAQPEPDPRCRRGRHARPVCRDCERSLRRAGTARHHHRRAAPQPRPHPHRHRCSSHGPLARRIQRSPGDLTAQMRAMYALQTFVHLLHALVRTHCVEANRAHLRSPYPSMDGALQAILRKGRTPCLPTSPRQLGGWQLWLRAWPSWWRRAPVPRRMTQQPTHQRRPRRRQLRRPVINRPRGFPMIVCCSGSLRRSAARPRRWGHAMRLGIEAAFAEQNRAGGVHGRMLELVTRDDRYEPGFAFASTRDLIAQERVFALIGEVGTPTSRSAVPLAESRAVPFVGPLTGAGFLRDPDLNSVVNLRASYAQETEHMVERLTEDLGVTRVAVMYQNDSFGQSGLNGVTEALDKRGLAPVATWYYERNSSAVKAAVFHIADAQPEAVIFIGAYQPVAKAITLLRMDIDPVFMAVSFVGGNALAQELGDEAPGVYVT